MSLGSLLGKAIHAIPGVGTAMDVLDIGSGILGTISGHKKQAQSDDLLKRAMALKQQGWDARAPLRASTLSLAGQPMRQREDLSSIFADPGNPYARSIPRPQTTATPQAPMPIGSLPAVGPSPLQQAMRRRQQVPQVGASGGF